MADFQDYSDDKIVEVPKVADVAHLQLQNKNEPSDDSFHDPSSPDHAYNLNNLITQPQKIQNP